MLQGSLDIVTHRRITGWARDEANSDTPVSLVIHVDDAPVAQILAEDYRPDLVAAGFGSGRHGFDLQLITPLPTGHEHRVTVVREEDGTPLPGSPATVPKLLQGSLDVATHRRITGWARDEADPDTPVSLVIHVDDAPVAQILAEDYRPDLVAAGFGSGRHGFDFQLVTPLPSGHEHRVTIVREEDGTPLPGSPATVPKLGPIEQALQDALDPALAEAELRATAAALARQASAVLDLLARRRLRGGERVAYRVWQDRWRRAGSGQPGEMLPPPQRRALVLDERLPVPGRDAGSNALLSHAASLQRLGFEVTLVGTAMQPDGADAALIAQGFACCMPPWYSCAEEVLRREADGFDLVYLHRMAIARDYIGLVRRNQPRARAIYSVADLHHLRLTRQAEVERRPELRAAARQIRAQELAAAWSADEVVTHSIEEAALLRRDVPNARVHVVPWSIAPRPVPTPFVRRSGLAFIGHYTHEPNLDAAFWLIEEILPLVRRHDPSIQCYLAGTDMPAILQRPRDGVVVLGAVADLATVFDRVRLTVAPLAYGAGVKGKVLDSLAAGIPCVCSPIAAEGLSFPEPLSGLVAADGAGLARLVLRLHDDAALNAACAAAGLALIRDAWCDQALDDAMRTATGLSALQAASAPT